jgi:hypothetical protein
MIDFELDPIIEQIAREARRPVAVNRDARDRLLEAVRAEPAPAPALRGWRTAFERRSIVVSPSRIAMLAAGLVGIGVLLGSNFGRDSRQTGQPLTVAGVHHLPASTDTVVTFVFPAPTATTVSVVGDFNQWNATTHPMTRLGNTGMWSVTVPMSVGRHIYSFVAVTSEGEKWSADPWAPAAPDDGFGRANSVVLVGKGSTS